LSFLKSSQQLLQLDSPIVTICAIALRAAQIAPMTVRELSAC